MRRALWVMLVAAFLGSGCGKPVTPTAKGKGMVALDNKPLEDGQISFVTPGKPPESLTIKKGVFEGTVEVGEPRLHRALRGRLFSATPRSLSGSG
jgi:hypothetical protein